MGTTRQVLAFPRHNGLQMTPSVGTGNVPYSVVTTFRIARSPRPIYGRILDQLQGRLDAGFYILRWLADYYADAVTEATRPDRPFSPNNVYATVAITSLPRPR